MPKILKIILIVVAVVILAMLGLRMWTKSFSPAATAQLTQGDLEVKVDYCQPAVKGRVIFGELVPYGQVWRTGANEATVVEINRDVKVAGSDLKAGKYSLWTVPTPENWTIIFNSETGQWGTMYANDKDVLKVEVPSVMKNNSTERFSIDLQTIGENSIEMILEWDKTRVSVPFE
jgi:hypothetical protein